MGPSGSAQGGQQFYTLTTAKVVVRRAWMELPTPASGIARVHLLAKGMPALPGITDRAGRVIYDVIDEAPYGVDDDDIPLLNDDANLPGVHTDKTKGDDKIPGVDPVPEQAPTPAETTENNDIDFAPANDGNIDPPMVDAPPPVEDVPVVNQVHADNGVRRTTRICTQAKPSYIPVMTGNSTPLLPLHLVQGCLATRHINITRRFHIASCSNCQ